MSAAIKVVAQVTYENAGIRFEDKGRDGEVACRWLGFVGLEERRIRIFGAMIRSSIYSGVKWKPINKTAAHGMSGHVEKLVSLADNPTPELGRLRTALHPFGLTEESPFYEFYVRVRVSRMRLPKFIIRRLRDGMGRVVPGDSYQVCVALPNKIQPFNEWAREVGFLAQDASGPKKQVVLVVKRLKHVFTTLPVLKSLLPKKDPLWRTEVREMRILDYEENGPAVVA